MSFYIASKFDLAVILVHARGNRVSDLVPPVPLNLEAIRAAVQGSVTHVGV